MTKLGHWRYQPAQPFGRLSSRAHVEREAREERAERALVKSPEFSCLAVITNMSRSGLAIRTVDSPPHLVGARLTISGSNVGILNGIARWQRGNIVGLQFDKLTSTRARLKAYFSFSRRK